MLKNIVSFESKVKEKTSIWYLDNDCPLEIAKEMLFQFQKMIGQIEDQVKAQQEQSAKEAKSKQPDSNSKVESISTEVNDVQS